QHLSYSPDGRLLAGARRSVRIWDADTGQETTITAHADYLTGLRFSHDSRRLATFARDRTIAIWDAQSGRELARLAGHAAGITCVAFSPDDRLLASGSSDG